MRSERMRIKDYPDNFKEWVRENEDNIAQSRGRGTEPYFIRNNAGVIDNILNPDATPVAPTSVPVQPQPVKRSIAEVAAERHAARTPEQINDIKQRWQQRIEILETQSTLNEIAERAARAGITYNNVARLSAALKEDEIISKVGGGDMTGGSCSSLAFTYAANKIGFDVRDFRGGESRYMFSLTGNIMDIAEKTGGVISKHTNDYTKAKELLSHVVEGKEYYFTCCAHAAVVRKTADGKFEYLELQSPSDNGWKPLNYTALRYRFGAKKSHTSFGSKYETRECLIEFSLFRRNYGFRKMLGYINTDEAEQKKGKSGTTK